MNVRRGPRYRADLSFQPRFLPAKLSFRTLTVLLVVVSTLPLAILTGVLLTRLVADQQAANELRLLQLARAQSLILDRELDASVRTLMAIAQSERLATGDLEAFDRQARQIVPTQPSWHALFLWTPDGRRMIDTSRPPGTPSREVIESASFERVLKSKEPAVGSLRRGVDSLAFPVRVPVMRGDRVQYVLTALVRPDALREAISRELPPGEEWARTVADADGIVVVRTRDAERFVGQPATAAVQTLVSQHPEAVVRDLSMDDEPVYLAYTRSARYGWTSAVSVPLAAFDGPVQRTFAALSAFGALAIALTGLGAWLLAGRVARRLHETAQAAEMLARGERPRVPASIVSEVTMLAGALDRSGELLARREQERDAHLHAAQEAQAAAESSQKAVEAAARAKDEFLAMLGHELRNPLAPIVTALHLLKLRGAGEDREHGIIARQVQHLTRLVEDLLDVSRIARGMIELIREPVDVREAIEQALEMSGPAFEARQHRLEVTVPGGCVVIGDRARLAQVFANVLVNAAKYTPPGGRVTVSALVEGETVTVSVRDSGEGIAPGLLPHVFDLFTQGARTADRRHGGLGLGLTIVQQLVLLHGGSVAAESAGEDQGSTFVIRLPAAPAGTAVMAAGPPEPRARAGAGDANRILVVDDNQDAAEMLGILLSQHGHHVQTAFDGPNAFDVAAGFRPDVVILDIGLPVLDGYEVAERLRAQLHPDAPAFIAVTGYAQEHDRARSSEAGFAAHFVKPLDFEQLTDTLVSLAVREGPGN